MLSKRPGIEWMLSKGLLLLFRLLPSQRKGFGPCDENWWFSNSMDPPNMLLSRLEKLNICFLSLLPIQEWPYDTIWPKRHKWSLFWVFWESFWFIKKGMAWLNTATSPSSCLDYRCDVLSWCSHFGPMKAMLNRITETTCPGIIKLLSQCHHLPTFNFLLFEKHKTLFVETIVSQVFCYL